MTPKCNAMYKTKYCCNLRGDEWENSRVMAILFDDLRLRVLNSLDLEINATQRYKTW